MFSIDVQDDLCDGRRYANILRFVTLKMGIPFRNLDQSPLLPLTSKDLRFQEYLRRHSKSSHEQTKEGVAQLRGLATIDHRAG